MARSTQSSDLEFHIRNNYPWSKLPPSVKQVKVKTFEHDRIDREL